MLKRTALVLVILAPLMRSQSDTPIPKWEAISIRPCSPAEKPVPLPTGPGLMTLPCAPVEAFIHQSYLLFPNGVLDIAGAKTKVERGPAWMYSALYTIQARAESIPGEPPPSQSVMRSAMLRVLLADRFKLQVHHEAVPSPVYALTVTKDGPKFQHSPEGSCVAASLDLHVTPGQPPLQLCGIPRNMAGGFEFHGATMAQVSSSLSQRTDRDVIDKTGLTGMFDLTFNWSGDPNAMSPMAPPPPGQGPPPLPAPGAAPSPDPSEVTALIQTALQKLGLKLEPAQGTQDVLIVDHIEKPPDN